MLATLAINVTRYRSLALANARIARYRSLYLIYGLILLKIYWILIMAII